MKQKSPVLTVANTRLITTCAPADATLMPNVPTHSTAKPAAGYASQWDARAGRFMTNHAIHMPAVRMQIARQVMHA
jgi:hypothetical protein